MPVTDPEVRLLAGIAHTLQADYAAALLPWQDSPFAWIKTRPSRQVGSIGEKLLSGYLAAKGFNVARSPDSEADRVIEGLRCEIKFSTLWEGGFYKFQQLRDQNYALAICPGDFTVRRTLLGPCQGRSSAALESARRHRTAARRKTRRRYGVADGQAGAGAAMAGRVRRQPHAGRGRAGAPLGLHATQVAATPPTPAHPLPPALAAARR
jgi:hypothetical protein